MDIPLAWATATSILVERALVPSGGLVNSGVYFLLRPPDNIVDPASNLFNLALSVEASPDLVVGLDEALELLLETVVLVVQVGHVLVESVNFSLEVDLVLEHLL